MYISGPASPLNSRITWIIASWTATLGHLHPSQSFTSKDLLPSHPPLEFPFQSMKIVFQLFRKQKYLMPLFHILCTIHQQNPISSAKKYMQNLTTIFFFFFCMEVVYLRQWPREEEGGTKRRKSRERRKANTRVHDWTDHGHGQLGLILTGTL